MAGIPVIYFTSLTLVWILMAVLLIRRVFSPPTFFLVLNYRGLVLAGLVYIVLPDFGKSANFMIEARDSLLLQAIIISCFSFAIIGGYYIGQQKNALAGLFPVFDDSQHDSLILLGIFLLTCCSIAVFLYLMAIAGGNFVEAVHITRHGEALSGLHFVREFNRMGTLISSAYWISLIKRKRDGENVTSARIWFVAVLFIFCFVSSAIYGGKSFLVFPFIILGVCYAVILTRYPVRIVVIAVIAVVTMVVGLQYYRIAHVAGADYMPLNHTVAALGLRGLDTNQIYLRVMTKPENTYMGEDFVNGLAGVVPRSLWSGKPENISPGGRFTDIFVPRYEGAWPPFAPNLWYANFSWPGVIIGGLLTGLILAAITLRYRHAYTDPFALAFMAHFTILFTFGGGVDNLIFMKFVKGVLPLFIFKALSQKSLVPRDFTKKA